MVCPFCAAPGGLLRLPRLRAALSEPFPERKGVILSVRAHALGIWGGGEGVREVALQCVLSVQTNRLKADL